ncbi:glycosyltransferase family 1 protein [Bacillus zanthoxyli]|nr:glycosyltransferase family 1 protein [Bacillus zanthoxyli]
MKKVKILYVLGAFSSSGGVENIVLNILENIDSSKFKIDFVLFDGLDHSQKDALKKYDSKIFYVDRIRKKPFKFIYDLYKILRKEQYSIIHAHINEMGFFPLLSGLLARTPVRICHSHNTIFSNMNFVPVFRFFSRFVNTHLMACTNAAGKALFGEKEKYAIFNNGIHVDNYLFNPEEREKVKKELGLEGKFILGHVGRLTEQKNHKFMLEICRRLVDFQKDTMMLFIGDGELRESLEKQVQNLELENNVLFLGARSDVNSLLQAMDVFLFPSHYEGLGIVLIEAQSAGLPCIVSDNITKEVEITDLVHFLSLDMSVEHWSQTIQKYSKGYQRKNMYTDIKRNGYEIKSSIGQLENFYLDTLNVN